MAFISPLSFKLLRPVALGSFGPEAAYSRWMIVPLAILATVLPGPVAPVELPEAVGLAAVPLSEALPIFDMPRIEAGDGSGVPEASDIMRRRPPAGRRPDRPR